MDTAGGKRSRKKKKKNDIIKSDRPLPLTMQSALQTAAPISNIPPFDLLELMRKALRSMRSRWACDESGLVAEMFKHENRALHERLLEMYNNMLQDECLEVSWQDSLFKMLPKTAEFSDVSNRRPMAVLSSSLCSVLSLGDASTAAR